MPNDLDDGHIVLCHAESESEEKALDSSTASISVSSDEIGVELVIVWSRI